jgi:cytochrome c biogenesis DsbD-like protein
MPRIPETDRIKTDMYFSPFPADPGRVAKACQGTIDKIPSAKCDVNRKTRAGRLRAPAIPSMPALFSMPLISGLRSCSQARRIGYYFPFGKAVKSVNNRLLSLASLALLATAPAMAQSASAQATPKVSFAYLTPPAHPGATRSKAAADSLTLNVHIELAEGWHINSEAPLDSFLVPTSLDLKSVPPEGVAFGKPRYPQPMIQHNPVMGDLSLYTGAFDVQVPAKKGKGKDAAQPARTRVTLHYQSCNNTMCLPPKSITVEQ